jgi:hypothetical protein
MPNEVMSSANAEYEVSELGYYRKWQEMTQLDFGRIFDCDQGRKIGRCI